VTDSRNLRLIVKSSSGNNRRVRDIHPLPESKEISLPRRTRANILELRESAPKVQRAVRALDFLTYEVFNAEAMLRLCSERLLVRIVKFPSDGRRERIASILDKVLTNYFDPLTRL
jgi:hypothetical protein